jgi:hypothetical protein
MDVQIRGKQLVELTENEYIAQGGKARVYGKGDTIFKVYHDPKDMIPEGKIQELGCLVEPNIIKPEDVLLDEDSTPIGYTMRRVQHCEPLCKLFMGGFRTRNSFTPHRAVMLAETIRDIVSKVHDAGILIVDGNEFSYLVDSRQFAIPYFIDVDSYQTKSYPAPAISPSIRDWHAQSFSELTDWFSFAIVVCQLFVGIHPYKGKHLDYKRNDIESRMKDNVSIFGPGVSLPKSARDFSHIPKSYLEWFIKLFEKGERSEPPMIGPVSVAKPKKLTLTSSASIEISEIESRDHDILFFATVHGQKIVKTRGMLHVNKARYGVSPDSEVVFTPKTLVPVFAGIYDGRLALQTHAMSKQIAALPLECSEMMVVDNALYIRSFGKLTEIAFHETGQTIVSSVKAQWDFMPQSSKVYSGCVYQDVLGRPYFAIPVPREDGLGSCFIKEIPELAGYKVVDARRRGRVLMVMGHKGNRYDRHIFVFSDDYSRYGTRIAEDIEPSTGLNFTVLDNGVAVHIPRDGTVEAFFADPDKPGVRAVRDRTITSEMRLCKDRTTAAVIFGQGVFGIRMVGKQ